MAKPTRVLHIITRLIVGGAQENTLLTVLGQHRDPQYHVALLAGPDEGPEGSLVEQARAIGVPVLISKHLTRPLSPTHDARALVELMQHIRAGSYDIVHTHCAKAGILGRLAARLMRVPVVVHTYHSLPFHKHEHWYRNALYIALNRLCAPLTDHFICVCADLQRRALKRGIGSPDQYSVVASGMQLERFLKVGQSLTPRAARERLGIPAHARVVGKIARCVPLKGHSFFLDAAERFAHQHPDVWLLFVGGGPLQDDLQERLTTLGLADRARFLGLVPPSEIPACLQAMDILVHTSLREGLARVLPQAGAVGKPVVTFRMDGAPEIIDHGRSGYLCPPKDSASVAHWVDVLLRDSDRRERMGQAGRQRVTQAWHAHQMVEGIHDVYMKCL